MRLAGSAALITGGKRIGAAVARALAGAGMDVGLSYNTSRADAEAAAADVTAAGRRAHITAANLSQSRRLPRAGGRYGGGLRPPRRADQHGVGVCRGSVRSARRACMEPRRGRRSARGVPLRARRDPAHAASRRRAHRQFRRLGRGQRTAAVSRVSSLLRRQGRSDCADGSARARSSLPTTSSSTRSRPGRSWRRPARPTRS